MINLRRCLACQLHCNDIESGLQVHEVLLTEIIFTSILSFSIFLQLLTKIGEVRLYFYAFLLCKVKDIPCVPQQCQSHQIWSGDCVQQCCIPALLKNHMQSVLLSFLCQSKLVCTGLSLKERLCIGDSPCSAIASRCCLVGYPM